MFLISQFRSSINLSFFRRVGMRKLLKGYFLRRRQKVVGHFTMIFSNVLWQFILLITDSIEYNETLETSSSFSRSEKHEDLNTSETRIEDRIRKPIHCIPVGGTEVFFRGKGWRRRREKHKEGIWWRMFKLSCEQENMVPISSFPENEKGLIWNRTESSSFFI